MKIFDNRIKMLSLVEQNGVIAELGVLNGDFSAEILKNCNPTDLFLIDKWSGNIISGDENGNNVRTYDGAALYKYVKNRFAEEKSVSIERNSTECINIFNDNLFDMIYIDADHSYSGCLSDLKNCFNKVKNGGYLMLHDYDTNKKKTKNSYNFGVHSAVEIFCSDYKQKVFAKAMDGCVSVAIKIKK